MKKIIFISLILFSTKLYAQQFITRTGFISFFSATSMEDIKAENKQLLAIVNTEKKELAFMVLMKGFQFKKELMQTHFNENYVESDKYPKATFNGSYTGDIDMKNGSLSTVKVHGLLNIHGITKEIDVTSTMQLLNGTLSGNATFNVTPEDYNITIPNLVRNKIAKQVEVEIKISCIAKN